MRPASNGPKSSDVSVQMPCALVESPVLSHENDILRSFQGFLPVRVKVETGQLAGALL